MGQNRTQFSISFFIFGLLFLLFDLEILLVYPYSVSSYTNDIYGLVVMMVFFVLLTLGFIFELGKNALTIDSRQTYSYRNNDTRTLERVATLSNGFFKEGSTFFKYMLYIICDKLLNICAVILIFALALIYMTIYYYYVKNNKFYLFKYLEFYFKVENIYHTCFAIFFFISISVTAIAVIYIYFKRYIKMYKEIYRYTIISWILDLKYKVTFDKFIFWLHFMYLFLHVCLILYNLLTCKILPCLLPVYLENLNLEAFSSLYSNVESTVAPNIDTELSSTTCSTTCSTGLNSGNVCPKMDIVNIEGEIGILPSESSSNVCLSRDSDGNAGTSSNPTTNGNNGTNGNPVNNGTSSSAHTNGNAGTNGNTGTNGNPVNHGNSFSGPNDDVANCEHDDTDRVVLTDCNDFSSSPVDCTYCDRPALNGTEGQWAIVCGKCGACICEGCNDP